MQQKMHFKKKQVIGKNRIFILTVLCIVVSLWLVLRQINSKITPILMQVADTEATKISTTIVNRSINKTLEGHTDTNDIFSSITSSNGEIQTVDFNSVAVNQLLNDITVNIQKELALLEKGNFDLIKEYDASIKSNIRRKELTIAVPMGVVFKNSILSNAGPKISIRLHYIGDVNSNIKTKITPYGINNVMVEVSVYIEMTVQIILPFSSEKTRIQNTIPIAIKIIQGNIPRYYGGGLIKDSSLYSIPFE